MFISAYTTAATSSLPQPDTSGRAVLEKISNNNNNNRVLYLLRQESRLYTVSSDLAFSVGKQIDEQLVLQESDLYLPFH